MIISMIVLNWKLNIENEISLDATAAELIFAGKLKRSRARSRISSLRRLDKGREGWFFSRQRSEQSPLVLLVLPLAWKILVVPRRIVLTLLSAGMRDSLADESAIAIARGDDRYHAMRSSSPGASLYRLLHFSSGHNVIHLLFTLHHFNSLFPWKEFP